MLRNILTQFNFLMNTLKTLLFCCFILLLATRHTIGQNITLSGYIKEKDTQESIIGATVFITDLKMGCQSNNYGFYSITFPPNDSIVINISSIGYKPIVLKVLANISQMKTIYLEPQETQLDEVTINASGKEKVSESIKVSTISIPIKQLKDIPSLMGEKDIIKAIQLLPGVQSGTEGSNGLFVRGGGADQNLILMDEAKVYNVSHLFGFFSVFNGDALKSMEFIKGGFPARYGGRLSSVLDVQMKDGNKNSTHGEVGIGLITNRLTIESPLKKDKSSFIVSARRTYPDLLLSLAKSNDGSVLKTNFYDANVKFNFDINSKNRLFISSYFGKDNFFQRINKKGDEYRNTGFSWGNQTGTVRWNHIFNPKVFSNLSLIYSNFDYTLENSVGVSSQLFSSKLKELGIKYDIEFLPNVKHDIRLGVNLSNLNFTPNLRAFYNEKVLSQPIEIEQIFATDAAIYLEDINKINEKLTINYGIRAALFSPRSKVYTFIEPRLALNYNFKENWSFKGGYSIMNQPVQLLTNNGLGLSIDVWVPSSAKLPPQNSQQFNFGIVRDLSSKISVEVEFYSKKMKNILSFKEGASILSTVGIFQNNDFSSPKILWEDISTSGSGNSDGLELFVNKKSGKLTGWTSYTLSKTVYNFSELNQGKDFSPIHDRRHQLSIVGAYIQSKKIKFNGTFIISSGNPTSLPQLSYETFKVNPFNNELNTSIYGVVDYGTQRNQYRTPVYSRLDLSTQFLKNKKRGIRTWELGFYNVLGRRNVFAYELDVNGEFNENGEFIRTKKIQQISFLLFIPSISYYFKF